MKSKKTMTMVIITLLILFFVPVLNARGAADSENGYAVELQEKFDELLNAVEEGTITKEEALEMILEFQQENDRVNQEQYRYMESCLNDFETGLMTKTQTREKVAQMVQLKTNEQLMTQEQIQQKDQLQTKDQVQEHVQDKDGEHKDDSGSGNSKGN